MPERRGATYDREWVRVGVEGGRAICGERIEIERCAACAVPGCHAW